MKYRPEIDGLRSVAVVPVVLYHAGLPHLSGGFAGVDVFFVISGYLITRIIACETRERQFSFLHFYERRARRILPALFFVALATIVMSFAVMVPFQMKDLGQSIVAVLLFLSNVLFWKEAGYFAVESAFKPLLHTWSLAVEEQFYIIFPFVMIALTYFARRTHIPILASGLIMSLAAALYWGQKAPSATFFLIQFRAWELLTGAIVALWLLDQPRRPNTALASVGLGMVIISFFVATERSLWPGPLTLLPVLGAAAVILFADPSNCIGRVLSLEPIRFLGLISYSLYLWHVPLFVVLAVIYFGDTPAHLRALATIASLLFAVVSWRYIEQPFRSPQRVSKRALILALLAVGLPLMVFGLAAATTRGFQTYMVSRIPEEAVGRVIDRDVVVAARRPIWAASESAGSLPFEMTGERRILILGDSLSGDLITATGGHSALFPTQEFRRMRLDDYCMDVMAAALDGVNPLPTGQDSNGTDCAVSVRALQDGPLLWPAEEIVLIANWNPTTADNGVALAGALIREGKSVSIVGVAAFNDMASLSMQLAHINEPVERFFYRNIRSKFTPVNTMFAETAAQTPRLRYLDMLGLYCAAATASCDMLDAQGRPIIFDSAHLTPEGVNIMADRIKSAGWFE